MRTRPPEMTSGFLITNVQTMWFIGVEVDQETSASRPKKNPGSAPDNNNLVITIAGSSCRPQQGIFNKLPTFYKMTLLVAMQWQ